MGAVTPRRGELLPLIVSTFRVTVLRPDRFKCCAAKFVERGAYGRIRGTFHT